MPVVEEHQVSEKARFEGYTASNKLSQALIYSVFTMCPAVYWYKI